MTSLVVLSSAPAFLGLAGWIIVGAWALSGVLVFHRPTERVLARVALNLRRPTEQEKARLQPVWLEVTARAGVDGHAYELRVQESDDANAIAAAGHIVGVTSYASNQLPNGQLAAILAHELGHHVGGHAWSSILGFWYALPGRVTWRLLRALISFLVVLVSYIARFSVMLFLFGVAFLIVCVNTVMRHPLYALTAVILFTAMMLGTFFVPYAIASVCRRADLRADQYAAGLGFGPMLAAVLRQAESEHKQKVSKKGPALHPTPRCRLEHLEPYLDSDLDHDWSPKA